MIKKVLVILLFFGLIGFVNAAISLSEPLEVYNLGDRLYVTADGLVGADSGNLNIDLVCGEQKSNLLRISARAFSKELEQTYPLPYKILSKEDLEIENISSIIGSCQLIATMGSMATSSKIFTVTDNIIVTPNLDKATYNPGEGIQLTINAIKENGDLLNGFIQVTGSVDLTKAIVGGNITEVFSMPETTKAGTYSIEIIAYDTSTDGVLNQGKGEASFTINQVPSSLIPSLSETDVLPGTALTFGAEIFDQAGEKMEGSISARLLSPGLEESEKIVSSGEFITFEFPQNATAGSWTIFSSFGDLRENLEFNVLELQKVEFEIEDGILTVTNAGNTLYNKTIDIMIGEDKKTLELLNIEIGGIRKFKLEAPQGEYNVAVNDGESSINRQVMLTGNAISIEDLKNVGIFTNYSLVWIFLIIILGATGVIFFMKYRKTKTLGGNSKMVSGIKGSFKSMASESINFTNKSPSSQSLDSANYKSEDRSMVDLTSKQAGSAESALVIKGEKYTSAIVAISIKNSESLSDNSREELKQIVNESKESKGLVDWRNDYAFVIFSPLVTKTYHNEVLAVKTASRILEKIKLHNKKFNSKIVANLGVHSGELITSREGGKLKYTGLGNTISFAKRIADSDNDKLLISEEIRKKMLRDLKVEKAQQIGEKQVYSVSEIKNKEANEAKLKDLLKRMDK
ncbi:MAG: hypothetical protein NUV97_04250 [archaeon]|nr:hypothetical protein [archaeon]MCR4323538.1 hypothetical protein [Nanoarchaeota archaeon]